MSYFGTVNLSCLWVLFCVQTNKLIIFYFSQKMLNLRIKWLVMRNLWQWRVTFILFIRSEGCGIHVAKSICIWAIWDFGVSNSKLQPTRCKFFYLFIFTNALHVSGGSSAHHQEHITVHTASGIVNQYCC